MPVDAATVFDVLHDYDIRLEWDTLLRDARLTRGATRAEMGATSMCLGRTWGGMIGMETRYITYQRGVVAAVELVNRPPFFSFFAASIRHQDTDAGSTLTYKFRFGARPRPLAWLLEPIMHRRLMRETQRRLASLAAYLEESM